MLDRFTCWSFFKVWIEETRKKTAGLLTSSFSADKEKKILQRSYPRDFIKEEKYNVCRKRKPLQKISGELLQ